MTETEKRIAGAWRAVSNRDDMSDEELVLMAAKRAGVTYGEANAFLRCVPEVDLRNAMKN